MDNRKKIYLKLRKNLRVHLLKILKKLLLQEINKIDQIKYHEITDKAKKLYRYEDENYTDLDINSELKI